MNSLIPFMGAPQSVQSGLLGTASNYGYPITSGLLGALSQPHDYTQDALALAGNPHAGPYANAPGFPAGSGSPISTGSSGSSAGSVAGGLLTALAKNPALVKDGVGAVSDLLGGGLGAYGSGAAADAATTAALGTVGSQTAGEAAAIQAANDAALGGGSAAGAGGGAAGGGASGLGTAAGAAGALGLAALPLVLAATVPYNSGLGISDINSMEQQVANATKANGGPINAGYAMNPDGSINQANSQALTSLYTLLGDNPDEFTKAGGMGPVDQFLTTLGYGNLIGGAYQPITAPTPGGRGWLGGGYTGKSRA